MHMKNIYTLSTDIVLLLPTRFLRIIMRIIAVSNLIGAAAAGLLAVSSFAGCRKEKKKEVTTTTGSNAQIKNPNPPPLTTTGSKAQKNNEPNPNPHSLKFPQEYKPLLDSARFYHPLSPVRSEEIPGFAFHGMKKVIKEFYDKWDEQEACLINVKNEDDAPGSSPLDVAVWSFSMMSKIHDGFPAEKKLRIDSGTFLVANQARLVEESKPLRVPHRWFSFISLESLEGFRKDTGCDLPRIILNSVNKDTEFIVGLSVVPVLATHDASQIETPSHIKIITTGKLALAEQRAPAAAPAAKSVAPDA